MHNKYLRWKNKKIIINQQTVLKEDEFPKFVLEAREMDQ